MLNEEQLDRIQHLLKEADNAEKAGDLRIAERCYEQCVSLDDGSVLSQDEAEASCLLFYAYIKYAKLCEEQGDYKGAIRRAERALASDEWRPHALIRQGICYKELGRLDEAEKAYREAIAIWPHPPEAWLFVLLFSVVHETGTRDHEARELLEKALEINPNCDEAYYNLAGLSSKEGDAGAARRYLEKAIEVTPDYALAHRQLGILFLNQGDLESAGHYLKRAVELDPTSADAHCELAHLLLLEIYRSSTSQRQPELIDACEHHFRASIELDPSHVWSHAYLLNLYWVCGRHRQADAEGRRVVKRFPESSVAHWVYGDFLACDNRCTKKAESLLKRAVELDDQDPQAYFYYGKSLLRWERWHEARVMLEKADQLGDKEALPLLVSYRSNWTGDRRSHAGS
jgi:protein O-GlcNAc transferase